MSLSEWGSAGEGEGNSEIRIVLTYKHSFFTKTELNPSSAQFIAYSMLNALFHPIHEDDDFLPSTTHDKFNFAYNKCPPCAIEKSSRHKMGRWFVSLWNVDSHMKSIIGVRGEIFVCHLNRVVTWKIETTSCTWEKSSKLSHDIYNTQREETSHFAFLIKGLGTSWIWITGNGSEKREKTWIAQKAESGKLYVGYEIKAKGNYTSNENYFNISSFPSFSFIELTHSHSFVLLSLSWN